MRQSEQVVSRRGPVSPSKVSTGLSRNPKRVVRPGDTLLDLQRSHGNAFVQRSVQRKSALSQPEDRYEQEADLMAERGCQKDGRQEFNARHFSLRGTMCSPSVCRMRRGDAAPGRS